MKPLGPELGEDMPANDTILAACIDISFQPSFSRFTTSGSVVPLELGRIGAPEGAKPRIYASNLRWVHSSGQARHENYLHPHAGGPTSFNLMLVTEETYSRPTSSIIQNTWINVNSEEI